MDRSEVIEDAKAALAEARAERLAGLLIYAIDQMMDWEWGKLTVDTREALIAATKEARRIRPNYPA